MLSDKLYMRILYISRKLIYLQQHRYNVWSSLSPSTALASSSSSLSSCNTSTIDTISSSSTPASILTTFTQNATAVLQETRKTAGKSLTDATKRTKWRESNNLTVTDCGCHVCHMSRYQSLSEIQLSCQSRP